MGNQPLPLGTWGKIRTQPVRVGKNGKPTGYRARAKYRDFDGQTRDVERIGKSKADGEQPA